MPMYDFVCGDCRVKFELVVRLDQKDEPQPCERCGGKNVRRLFPRPALVGLGGKSAPPADGSEAAEAGAASGDGEGEEGGPKKSWEYNPENPYSTTNAYYGDDM